MSTHHDTIRAIRWQDDHLVLLDQRLLPHQETYIDYYDCTSAANAIRDMVVRGAPAIGITAAFAVVLAARERFATDPGNWQQTIETDLNILANARPTAVNLHWAIHRMRNVMAHIEGDPHDVLLAEAQQIHEQDIQANYHMAELGTALIEQDATILTHCNAGALATGGYGTALGVIRYAHAQGKLKQVYADETRPWLQGARLTAWELSRDQIPVQLIAEGAAAALMRLKKPDWVIVGSDRIAANGDVANKIGTYSLAVLAQQHNVKVMVVAPWSTVDLDAQTGEDIPIEYRDQGELLSIGQQKIAPTEVAAWNPVFDVTPAHYVDAIVTERGVAQRQPGETQFNLAALQA